MSHRELGVLVGLLLVAAPAAAQGQRPVRDSLQARVMNQFLQNYRRAAQLSGEQMLKTQDVLRRSFHERNQLGENERGVWQALEDQLRPGVAANADSLAKLLDTVVGLQEEQVAQARREQAAYAEFLTPVQRALLTIELRRLQMRVEQMMQNRARPPMRPGG